MYYFIGNYIYFKNDFRSKVSCIPEELGLDLDIRIQPCVFAGEPCGPKGECERTHHGLHTFSSCLCFGGKIINISKPLFFVFP